MVKYYVNLSYIISGEGDGSSVYTAAATVYLDKEMANDDVMDPRDIAKAMAIAGLRNEVMGAIVIKCLVGQEYRNSTDTVIRLY